MLERSRLFVKLLPYTYKLMAWLVIRVLFFKTSSIYALRGSMFQRTRPALNGTWVQIDSYTNLSVSCIKFSHGVKHTSNESITVAKYLLPHIETVLMRQVHSISNVEPPIRWNNGSYNSVCLPLRYMWDAERRRSTSIINTATTGRHPAQSTFPPSSRLSLTVEASASECKFCEMLRPVIERNFHNSMIVSLPVFLNGTFRADYEVALRAESRIFGWQARFDTYCVIGLASSRQCLDDSTLPFLQKWRRLTNGLVRNKPDRC